MADQPKFSLVINPGLKTPETDNASATTKDFRNQLSNAGYIELSKRETRNLARLGIFPKNIDSNTASGIATTSSHLYGVGVTSAGVKEAAEKSSLTPQQQQYFGYVSNVIYYYEAADPNLTQDLQVAGQQPTVYFAGPDVSVPSGVKQIFFTVKDNVVSPLVSEPKDRIGRTANKKIKRWFMKSAPKGAKKVAKKAAQLAKKLPKKAAKTLAKQGVKKAGTFLATRLGLAAVLQAAGSVVPIVGNIIALAAQVLLEVTLGLVKKLINWARDNPGEAATAALLAGGLIMSSPLLIALGVGFGLLTFLSFIVIPIILHFVGALIAFIVFVFVVAAIVFIINSGAYIVPESIESEFPGIPPGTGRSLDIQVEKTSDSPDEIQNSQLPHTVNYTIIITALRGSLTNITYNNEYSVFQVPQVASPPNPTMPQPPGIITPIEPESFEYSITLGNEFEDSVVCDSFTVSATIPDGTTDSATASLCITIGTPPEDCPAGWPVDTSQGQEYFIGQGPFGTVTHGDDEAIDVHPYENGTYNIVTSADRIIATHQGRISDLGVDGYGGLYVDILGQCAGSGFRSRHVHFSSISSGLAIDGQVTRGTVLGIMGQTGWAAVPHNHYEFMGESSYFNPPILMGSPFIPVPRTQIFQCASIQTCNTCINFPCP
jgi:murein DD-endopeptidase MepM/ murein hydrolase activator NlpD